MHPSVNLESKHYFDTYLGMHTTINSDSPGTCSEYASLSTAIMNQNPISTPTRVCIPPSIPTVPECIPIYRNQKPSTINPSIRCVHEGTCHLPAIKNPVCIHSTAPVLDTKYVLYYFLYLVYCIRPHYTPALSEPRIMQQVISNSPSAASCSGMFPCHSTCQYGDDCSWRSWCRTRCKGSRRDMPS
jgi:hypothetical protein